MTRLVPVMVTLLALFTACQPANDALTPFDCPFTIPNRTRVTCYRVTVPTDHDEPGGGTIQVAAAVIKARGLAAGGDPLVVVEGGPGGSAVESLAPVFALPDLAFLREGRDVVIIEQRGTFHSRPALDCPDLAPPGVGRGYDIAAHEQCRSDLVAEGAALDAYNSLQNAADIPAVVSALGYEGYHFMGLSYGTMLAQHLMREHPGGLRSVVLDSTAPLETSFLSALATSAERGFAHFFAACAADAYCSAAHPDLEATFWSVVATLDAEPVEVALTTPDEAEPLSVTVDGGFVAAFLFESLYNIELIPHLPGYIAALAEGDTTWVAEHGYDLLVEPTFSEGMFYTTLCAEDGGFTPEPADLRPVLDAVISAEWEEFRALCDVWDVAPLPDVVNQPVTAEIPVLLLAGAFDPITPPAFAEQVAEALPQSTVVTLPGASHGAVGGGACPLTLLAAFLDEPSADLDTSCAAEQAVSFSPPLEFYTLEPRTVGEAILLVPARWQEVQPGTFAPNPTPDGRQVALHTRNDRNPQRAAREFITGLGADGWQKFGTDDDGPRTWHIFLAQFGADLMIISATAEGETTTLITFIAPERLAGDLADVVYFPAVAAYEP